MVDELRIIDGATFGRMWAPWMESAASRDPVG
jgi:hypothetical protein